MSTNLADDEINDALASDDSTKNDAKPSPFDGTLEDILTLERKHIPYCDDSINTILSASAEDFKRNYAKPGPLYYIAMTDYEGTNKARVARALVKKVLDNVDIFIHVVQSECEGVKPDLNFKRFKKDFSQCAHSNYKTVFAQDTRDEAIAELKRIHSLKTAPVNLMTTTLSSGTAIIKNNDNSDALLKEVPEIATP